MRKDECNGLCPPYLESLCIGNIAGFSGKLKGGLIGQLRAVEGDQAFFLEGMGPAVQCGQGIAVSPVSGQCFNSGFLPQASAHTAAYGNDFPFQKTGGIRQGCAKFLRALRKGPSQKLQIWGVQQTASGKRGDGVGEEKAGFFRKPVRLQFRSVYR